MIVREQPDGRLLIVSQTSHGLMTATFCRHYGNQDFARPEPYDAVLAGAAQHEDVDVRPQDDPEVPVEGRDVADRFRAVVFQSVRAVVAFDHDGDRQVGHELLRHADRSGPGSLELNPTMDIPAYARHEIHIQPGGYVGDPFAGHIYHYGTNSYYISVIGNNEQDQVHRGTVARLPVPADGKVRRILDYGCGIGQMTVALKERFPDAEVWGIDVGGPMVRYAHLRAGKLGVAANFAQRLAEASGFPDGHFDIVTSYITHHELPAATTRKVIEEARRVTRPGGVFYPLDFNSGGVKSIPRGLYARWWDHRWNNEVWSFEYHALDFNAEIASRGFTHIKATPAALPGFGARHFVRTA